MSTNTWYHGAWDGWQGWRESGPADSAHWSAQLGIHFTSREVTAQAFARGEYASRTMAVGWRGEVVRAKLHLRRPFIAEQEVNLSRVALRVARKKGLVSAQEVSEWENRHGISCQDLLAEGSGIEGEIYLVDDILNFAVGAGGAGLAMREYLQAGGYDGVLYGNGYEGVGEDCAVVFKAEQIEVLKVAGVAHFKQRALSVF